MKQNPESTTKLIVVAAVTALGSFFLTSIIFSSPNKHELKAPTVDSINATFPDIKNDPAYNTILNSNSLDATQPVQVGNSQNNQPFNQ